MAAIMTMVTMATTISLTTQTRDMLKSFGDKGESYDEIIRRLVREAGWKRLDARWNKILEGDDFIPLEDL